MKTAIMLVALTLLGCTGLIPAKQHGETDGEWSAKLASVEVGDSITDVREKLGLLSFGVSGVPLEDGTVGFYGTNYRDGRYFVGFFAPDQKLLRSQTITNHPISFLYDERKRMRKEQRDAYLASQADLPNGIRSAMESESVCVGMIPRQVILSIGQPKRKNMSGGNYGSREQWVYGETYLYFENGHLTSWTYSR